MKLDLKTIVLVAGVIVIAIIVLQNTETVETQILFFSIGMPRAVLLFTAAAIGFVLGLMARRRILHEARPREKD